MGKITENFRKELRNIKIVDNRKEVFVSKRKELSTHFFRNDGDRRSSYSD